MGGAKMRIYPSLHLAEPSREDPGHPEGVLIVEGDVLQDYYQQAIMSDGLQRIDEWTYVIQDWNEQFGVLEVSLFAVTFVNGG